MRIVGNSSHISSPTAPSTTGATPVAAVANVSGMRSGLVAADHHGCVDETRWVSALPFAQNGAPRLGAIVVHTDPRWPDAGAVLRHGASPRPSPLRARGVRRASPDPVCATFADTPRSLREHASCGFAAVTFELWCYAHQLPDAAALRANTPRPSSVLEPRRWSRRARPRHTAYPRASAPTICSSMTDLAALPNVVAKHPSSARC